MDLESNELQYVPSNPSLAEIEEKTGESSFLEMSSEKKHRKKHKHTSRVYTEERLSLEMESLILEENETLRDNNFSHIEVKQIASKLTMPPLTGNITGQQVECRTVVTGSASAVHSERRENKTFNNGTLICNDPSLKGTDNSPGNMQKKVQFNLSNANENKPPSKPSLRKSSPRITSKPKNTLVNKVPKQKQVKENKVTTNKSVTKSSIPKAVKETKGKKGTSDKTTIKRKITKLKTPKEMGPNEKITKQKTRIQSSSKLKSPNQSNTIQKSPIKKNTTLKSPNQKSPGQGITKLLSPNQKSPGQGITKLLSPYQKSPAQGISKLMSPNKRSPAQGIAKVMSPNYKSLSQSSPNLSFRKVENQQSSPANFKRSNVPKKTLRTSLPALSPSKPTNANVTVKGKDSKNTQVKVEMARQIPRIKKENGTMMEDSFLSSNSSTNRTIESQKKRTTGQKLIEKRVYLVAEKGEYSSRDESEDSEDSCSCNEDSCSCNEDSCSCGDDSCSCLEDSSSECGCSCESSCSCSYDDSSDSD